MVRAAAFEGRPVAGSNPVICISGGIKMTLSSTDIFFFFYMRNHAIPREARSVIKQLGESRNYSLASFIDRHWEGMAYEQFDDEEEILIEYYQYLNELNYFHLPWQALYHQEQCSPAYNRAIRYQLIQFFEIKKLIKDQAYFYLRDFQKKTNWPELETLFKALKDNPDWLQLLHEDDDGRIFFCSSKEDKESDFEFPIAFVCSEFWQDISPIESFDFLDKIQTDFKTITPFDLNILEKKKASGKTRENLELLIKSIKKYNKAFDNFIQIREGINDK